MQMKNAAGRAATTATNRHTPTYGAPKELSTVESTAKALGPLVLCLIGQPLPQPECRVGWRLAEHWLGEHNEVKYSLCRGGT